MLTDLARQSLAALRLLIVLTVVLGIGYPLAVYAAGRAFGDHADGQPLHHDGMVVGSRLLAQNFEGDQWFQPRPSAAAFATVASGASNLAPSNPALAERIAQDAQRLVGEGVAPVPMQLVTTSGSGLDPHLSPAAARWQIARVAAARGIPANNLERLVEQHTERPLVGPAVVNVLALNLALADNRAPIRHENTP